jgi:hypothetical protein
MGMVTARAYRAGCVGLLLLVAACGGDEAGAERSTAPDATTPVGTRLVVVSDPVRATLAPISPELVSHCVDYVPFAAYTGNFYMKAIWDIANQNVDQLRVVCEEMGHTDPAGLQRISDEKKAVDLYFASFTTTTAASVAPAPAAPAPAAPAPAAPAPAAPGVAPPGAPGCAAGSTLSPDGFCVAG